jgi:hypothetical protein
LTTQFGPIVTIFPRAGLEARTKSSRYPILRTFWLPDVPSDDFRADRATVQARFSAFGVLLLCRKIARR